MADDKPENMKVAGLKCCPICGKPACGTVAPFCSKRCADVDLHRWLGGVYALPASESDDEASLDEESGA